MDIIFILTEPAVPENIGAAARAMKTMGFSEMRIVNSDKHLEKEAKWLAHGSYDIIENAKVFDTLEECIQDIDFTLATTAKRRSVKFDYYTPEEAKENIIQKSEILKKVAIIFGREESGLTNEELAICDVGVTIPLKATYPSINLAQSVMILAYVFSSCELKKTETSNNNSDYTLLKRRAETTLNSLDIKTGSNLFGRIMERLPLINVSDINLFLSIISKIENKLK